MLASLHTTVTEETLQRIVSANSYHSVWLEKDQIVGHAVVLQGISCINLLKYFIIILIFINFDPGLTQQVTSREP